MGDYANGAAIVTPGWVAEHGNDAGVRLVEVDVDTNAYDEAHLAGAVGWHWQNQLQQQPARDIPTKAEWEALLSQSGISNDTHVVLYGDNNNWFAAFAYWLFKLYGHDKVSLMNGGRVKWMGENRPVTTEVPSHAKGSYQAKNADPSVRAYRDDVKEFSGDSNRGLVDVRSPAEFSGELIAPAHLPQEGAQRAGHVPGAANIPWGTAVNEDGTFKSADELASIYGGKGITSDKETIAYCRIGERSAHTWYVLTELLGYPNVRNYDGSWTEWGSLIAAPIER